MNDGSEQPTNQSNTNISVDGVEKQYELVKNPDFDIDEVEKPSNMNIRTIDDAIPDKGTNSNLIFKDYLDLCSTCMD